MQRFQTIVLGLGAMGSAAGYQLARRGHAVLGIDRFTPPHDQGSTHGDTRITRRAIGEGADYVPLACRSHEIWREVERATGKDLLRAVGCLVISSPHPRSENHVAGFFRNTLDAAAAHGIAHERLDAAGMRRRFPQFRVRDDEFGYFEPGAGFLRVEECVRAQLQLAQRHGARLLTNTAVDGFHAASGGVTVRAGSEDFAADHLIVAAGAWLPQFVPQYRIPFMVTRQVLHWFELASPDSPFLAEDAPVFIWELQDRSQSIYGFPAVDGAAGGAKIATEQYRVTTTPEGIERLVSADESAAMYRDYVGPYLAGVTGRCIRAATCLYTKLPGSRFLVDRAPEHGNVLIVSACSGHGFKHSAAIGEALAQQVIDGESAIDLGAFSFARAMEKV